MKGLSLLVLVLISAIIGLGSFTVKESNALSYMSDDPKACINCHVMNTAYNSWSKSSHSEFTTCNSCHVPHENMARKYAFKAYDGMRHSYVFTTRGEPQALRLKSAGQHVVQNNCINCHKDYLLGHQGVNLTIIEGERKKEKRCWDCHRGVPHGRVHSLSADRDFIYEDKQQATYEWIKEYLKIKDKK